MHRLPQSLKEGTALAVGKAPALQQGPQAATPVAIANLSGGTAVPRPILPQSSIRQDKAPAKRVGGAPPGRAGKEDSPPSRGGMPDTSPSPWRRKSRSRRRTAGHLPIPARRSCPPAPSVAPPLRPGGPTARLKSGASRPEKGPLTRIRHRPPLLAPTNGLCRCKSGVEEAPPTEPGPTVSTLPPAAVPAGPPQLSSK